MEFKKLSKKTLSLWLLRGGIGAVFVLAAFILGLLLPENPTAVTVIALVGGVSVLISLFFLLVFPIFSYRLYSFGYDERRFVVRCGVIFRHEIIIPLYQLQDLHREEGPLMLLFGLSSVSISTAGSNFSLGCLEREEADRMIEELEAFSGRRFEENYHEEV